MDDEDEEGYQDEEEEDLVIVTESDLEDSLKEEPEIFRASLKTK